MAISHSLTVDLSNQGISALPPDSPTLSALLVSINRISSLGIFGTLEMPPSKTVLSTSHPLHAWSRSTQPATMTTTITASGTTVIIASTSATYTDIVVTAEAQNTSHPSVPNPNGLRDLAISVGILGAVILIIVLVLMRARIWKLWKSKSKGLITKEVYMVPYAIPYCPEPQPTLDKKHRRFTSSSSCNTNSRAEQFRRDVPPPIYVSTSEGQDRERASMLSLVPVRADSVYLRTPSPRPPAYSVL